MTCWGKWPNNIILDESKIVEGRLAPGHGYHCEGIHVIESTDYTR